MEENERTNIDEHQTQQDSEPGLADRSEELEVLTDTDVRIRFYRAMASIDVDAPNLAGHLSAAIAHVFCDFCAIFSLRDDGTLKLVAAHDVNESLRARLDELDLEGAVNDRATHHVTQQSTVEPLLGGIVFDAEDTELRVDAHSVFFVHLNTSAGEPLGAMVVARHATRREFTEFDAAKLEWIASDVAAKIETGRLHRNLKDKNAELQEKAAALAEAVRQRDEFISAASHELRTPLSTVALQIALIRRELNARPRDRVPSIHHNVDALQRQVDRLSSLIERLLDTSQLTDGELPLEFEPVDVYELATEVVERFRPHAAEARVHLTLRGRPTKATLDVDRVDQVISNLLSNAVKYTREGNVRLVVTGDCDQVLIRVSDDGIGIPEAARRRIFHRFERGPNARQRSGMGLGLWITNGIVERLGGTIELKDSADDGSTFEVLLPRYHDHPNST